MTAMRWIWGGITGLGLLLAGGQGAIAQTPPTESAPEAAPPLSPPAAESDPFPSTDFQTYTLPKRFSIQIPQDWIFAGSEAEGTAIITNYPGDRAPETSPSATDIKTEILFVEEHPNTFVDQEVTALIERQYFVRDYTTVKVNDRTALRLWVADVPLDYSNQIITFVGYASYGTAMIVTYYNAETAETEALIEQVHNSFELVF